MNFDQNQFKLLLIYKFIFMTIIHFIQHVLYIHDNNIIFIIIIIVCILYNYYYYIIYVISCIYTKGHNSLTLV